MILNQSPCAHGESGLLPVLTALESARVLRYRIDVLDTADADDLTGLRHEAAMLRHWLEVGHREAEYTALLEGLAAFADHVDHLLAEA
ncbi:hypothetical protein A8924_5726 [Saccharopolyspora erythraea NRRL 2338]|uniref:Uncharacterized protein n=1 Tax=Saccharopolyspora erythraea (strain ATCC 11635 / DSM 40517 / JCM 4748 / NBRC 13426 / NCIMB 8594 / NRRL 2338) TaxID=405948 RepID=A4FKK7_SACEN|nr:hypothetical protein [Saccharopolyspora erythraea]EQD82926.1 hypothetical protein N599_28060 [Saccharopolyspora erythraea D]PFG98220.1 hypothetical protein A8924_5726 [Saccharopolyspora erythraea NRRL 2338]QRK88318.1 hypothetical protein JQX30_27045 [Saccharopolyspora erythraea]QUH04412.1 hypothetical protein HUO13_29765 [Saccharopolyspora erythraea]CAM04582.1 hypothetical protein SACE_5344 [Saccharopolyspora erythraea NRRL 2338]